MDNKTIIAIDLETTSLHPSNGLILEVAAYHLDDNLDIIESFHGIFRSYETTYFEDVPRNMHNENNLIVESLASRESVNSLLCFLQKFDNVVFLGSSVSFDRDWILYKFPELRANISHRIIDVSSLLLLFPDVEVPPKCTAHRAVEDINRSIAIARCFRNLIQR